MTRNRSFRVALLAALIGALLLLGCSTSVHAQTSTNVSTFVWEYKQASPQNITTLLQCRNKVTTSGASLVPLAPTLARFGGPPATITHDGDGKPFLLGTEQAKRHPAYRPKKAAASAPVKPAAPAATGGSLRSGLSANLAQQPADTGDAVTPGTVTVTIDVSSIPAAADFNYVNEDGTWNANPYAATPTAPAPPGHPDVPTPSGFATGTRGGAVQGFKYWFDYSTTHVFGTWSAPQAPWFASGVLGTNGLLNGPTCELGHTTSEEALGSIVNICVCTAVGVTWCTIECRRKKIGVTGAKTGRFIANTNRLGITAVGAALVPKLPHLELTQISPSAP